MTEHNTCECMNAMLNADVCLLVCAQDPVAILWFCREWKPMFHCLILAPSCSHQYVAVACMAAPQDMLLVWACMTCREGTSGLELTDPSTSHEGLS